MRILHTSDWQIGMNFGFLNAQSRSLMETARFEVIDKIGKIASDPQNRIDFVLVTGDVFDSPRVSERSIKMVLNTIKKYENINFYVLVGNHEWNDNEYVYDNPAFKEYCPENFILLEAGITSVGPNFEIVAVPLQGKKENYDLVAAELEKISPNGKTRVLAAHGQPDTFLEDISRKDKISIKVLHQHLNMGNIHYVALGDTHSAEKIDDDNRIWYSGAPEPTSFREPKAGYVLIVDLTDPSNVQVKELSVATWKFHRIGKPEEMYQINTKEDLDRLQREIESQENPMRTAIKIYVESDLDLAQDQRRVDLFKEWEGYLAGFIKSKRCPEPRVRIDPLESSVPEELSGYLLTSYLDLREVYSSDPKKYHIHGEALRLLMKYAGLNK